MVDIPYLECNQFPPTIQGQLLLTWISNGMSIKLRDEITYPFPNFNGCTVEVCEWIRNFITHFIMGAITYPGCTFCTSYELFLESDDVSSPRYPDNYPHDARIEWRITVSISSVRRLNFVIGTKWPLFCNNESASPLTAWPSALAWFLALWCKNTAV